MILSLGYKYQDGELPDAWMLFDDHARDGCHGIITTVSTNDDQNREEVAAFDTKTGLSLLHGLGHDPTGSPNVHFYTGFLELFDPLFIDINKS